VRARSLVFLLGFWLCTLPSRGGEFEAANQLYDEGKYAEAKAGYEKLVAAGEWSANLFYNLGNASHRLGAPGEATLGYERALALDPGHPEARANLAFVRGQTGAVPWPASWLDSLFSERWTDAYVLVGTLAAWLAVFTLVRGLLLPRRDKAVLWFGTGAALMVAGFSAVAVWHLEQGRALAIVTAKTVEAHLAPAESSGSAAVLPAGSQVRVLSERGDWVYCALPTQGRGWISTKALGRVRWIAS
jgi:tetratricopeptide (TPR) repeat protein